MDIQAMNLAIMVGAILVTVAIFTSLISFRIGAPLLLVFLLLGLGAGVDGVLGIPFDDANAAFFIGSVALALILFDSGFNTPWQTFRTAAGPALSLATIGVLLTTLMVATLAHALFRLSWLEAFLLGAIVSSTDAAAVFFLLRTGGIALRERVRATLEVESSSNDPMAIFLTLTLVEVIVADAGVEGATVTVVVEFLRQLGLGALLGLLGGQAIRVIIDRANLDGGLYPIIFLALGLAVFGSTALLGGSGFLAVYVAGLIAGNGRMRHALGLRRFSHALTWLSQIAMFLTLGLLATPSEFPEVLLGAVVLAVFLMLVARPAAVWISLLPFRFTPPELTFIAWVGLRGAVSILLGIVPIIGGLGDGRTFFNVAFIVVLASLLVQGWSIGPVARRLGLIVPTREGPVNRVELELPGRGDHEVVAYQVHPESRVAKGERVPRWARPSLVLREGRSLRPHTAGRLQPGDQVYIVVSSNHVYLLDGLFAAPGEGSDPDLYGEFALDPEARLGDVAAAYDVEVAADEADLTLRAFLDRRLHGDVEPGDRVSLGRIDLIVRSAGEGHVVDEVGLGVEPMAQALPRLALLSGPRELASWIRRRLGRS